MLVLKCKIKILLIYQWRCILLIYRYIEIFFDTRQSDSLTIVLVDENSGDWTDETARDYNFWRNREPRGGECAVVERDNSGGEWRSFSCDSPQPFACKRDSFGKFQPTHFIIIIY